MLTFLQLTKNSKQDMSALPKHRLALLGDCATQHIATAIKGYAYAKGLALDVLDADYDQILPQVIDSQSAMYGFKPDTVLIFMCAEKLYTDWCKTPQDTRAGFSDSTFTVIKDHWGHITSNCAAKIMQFTFCENDDMCFGNFALSQDTSFIYQLRRLNQLIMESSTQNRNVFLVDLNGIQTRIGRERFFDAKLYYTAKIPISLNALPTVAANVVDVINAIRGEVKKCIILDLDNTLWGGVIGDDGLSGVQIGELGIGHAFTELQMWLKEMKNRGILLAVCSKNDEATAKEPFLSHDEMILRLDDFAVFVANWEDKAKNITHIRDTLNIGLDSMVFIDDNPFERDLVHALLPDVTIPDLPEDPADYLTHLKNLNLFEIASFSEEDVSRTQHYRAEAERTAQQKQYANYDEYLISLEMEALAAPFDEYNIPRIAQLTQRSNQFNLRTVRYTEAEVEAAASNPDLITIYFKLNDKYSDHGLISVVILEKRSGSNLFINTWLMSCRVLNRSMEEFIINKIIETGTQHGCNTITGEYIRTQKNAMVSDIYERLGFTRVGDNQFTANINSFTYNKTYIKEQNHEPE